MTDSLAIGPDSTGRQIFITDGVVTASAPAEAAILPCPDGVIAPGAVCAHTHLYSGLVPYGMPPSTPAPASFPQILERIWWRLDRALDAASLRASARDYMAKALLAGTTSLIDHHESPNLVDGSLEILADAAEELGVRALLCYGATERNGGRAEARAGLAECARVPASALVRGLVGLHASFTISDETIREAGDLARDLGTVVHVHVAEAAEDVEDAKARGYAGPLERLMVLDGLPGGSILAHGVHLDGEQVELAATCGHWLVQNPRSNEGNRVGYPGALGHSDKVALGTDGWNADMAEEEAALRRLAAKAGDRRAASRLAAGQKLIAERYGLTATGFAPGAVGDFVVRNGDGAVRCVVVGGRVVVRDGHLATADGEAIKNDAKEQAIRLWTAMATV